MGGASTKSFSGFKNAQDATQQMKQLLQQSEDMVKQFLRERESFRNQFNEKILSSEFDNAKSDLQQINNYYEKSESYLIKKMGQLVLKGYIELINTKVIECIQFMELTNQVLERLAASKKLLSNNHKAEIQIQKQREELSQNIKFLESFLFQYIDYEELSKTFKKQNIVIENSSLELSSLMMAQTTISTNRYA